MFFFLLIGRGWVYRNGFLSFADWRRYFNCLVLVFLWWLYALLPTVRAFRYFIYVLNILSLTYFLLNKAF
jgi:hypothetical protein